MTRGGVAVALLAALSWSSAALAGPPYDTDDPEPTALHHWEIYAFTAADRDSGAIDGAAGVDLNYGAVPGVQLTATLPVAFARDPGASFRAGSGDLELGVKYRFVDAERSGLQAAIFPRVILPTARRGLGGERVRLLLPLWLQKDIGTAALFGGGGYELNPGAGNRDFWLAGLAVTHDVSERLSLGAEVTHQSRDTDDGAASTTLGLGAIRKLSGPYSLLVSAGPTFTAHHTAAHAYLALGLAF